MSENICCPYFIVLDCADTDEHKHIGCLGCIDDGPGVDNDIAKTRCLGDFDNCPFRPRSE